MTKDGRPSLLNDIRLFHGASTRESRYLKGHEDAVAFARRLAWYLNGERVSLGSYSALYLLFTPSLRPGEIRITDEGGDWWQRSTHVGVPSEFPAVDDSSHLAMVGTVSALKAIRPDLIGAIEAATTVVRSEAENLRFLLKSRATKRYVVEISCNISEWPQPSNLFASLIDRSNGDYFEAEPLPLMFYSDALDLAGAIKVNTETVQIIPHQSNRAQWTAALHGGGRKTEISEFFPSRRPAFSRLFKRRG